MTPAVISSTDSVRVWRNARLATMAPDRPGLGVIEQGAIAVVGDRIAWVGPESDLPADFGERLLQVVNCEGRLVTPGLIDCHTHLVYAGDRAREFELRLEGASYEEIARQGGGIVSTVAAVRAAIADTLLRETLPRLDALLAEGVTTIEVKSGYGLALEPERRSLQVARQLGEVRPVTVKTSFLGAHAMPPEAAGDREAYIDLVANQMLPTLAAEGLIDAVDGFVEGIAFTSAQMRRVFGRAQELDLPVKLHADQLSDTDGAALAAEFRALSADHLEYTSEEGARLMAAAGTVAVLLPGAFYVLRETRRPPVDAFRQHGVPMAVSTDANPGTSPLTSLLLAMNMAATLFGLTVEECLLGVTRHAARALGMQGEVGELTAGYAADFAIWNVEQPAELVYRLGCNPLYQRVWSGQ